jgi:hypothetical protein
LTVESSRNAALSCANHSNTETNLRCSRCGKPICVRCVVQTPVGGRCRECANVRKAPIFLVTPQRYARAAAYGIAASIGGGVTWALLGSIPYIRGLAMLLLLALGYLVGEAVSRGAQGRISRGLLVMAGAFTVLSILIGEIGVTLMRLPATVPLAFKLQLAVGSFVGGLLGNIMALLFFVLAVVIAVSRVR